MRNVDGKIGWSEVNGNGTGGHGLSRGTCFPVRKHARQFKCAVHHIAYATFLWVFVIVPATMGTILVSRRSFTNMDLGV